MKWLHFNPYTFILLQWAPPLSFSTWPRGESPTNPSKDPQSDTNPAQTTGETSVFPVAVTTWAILWRALPMIPLRRTFQRGPRCFQSLTPATPRGSPVLSRSQPSTTFVRMRMKSWSSNCEPCHSWGIWRKKMKKKKVKLNLNEILLDTCINIIMKQS